MDWKIATRICKLPACKKSFTPLHYRQNYCHKDCHKKHITVDLPEKVCAYKFCNMSFKPRTTRQIYHTDGCNKAGRAPHISAASKAANLKRKKFAYKGDSEFRLIVESLKVLKCTQEICLPNCRIKSIERLGCVA